MPNRFQSNQHALAYKFIAARDGEHCLKCGKAPPNVVLQIDHADNDPGNWEPENLHILCRKDNLELRGKSTEEHLKLIRIYSANNEREMEKRRGNKATSMVREMVDYTQGSTEMEVNAYTENQWRDWVLSEIRDKGFIGRVDAVDGGAEVFGVSTLTIERYLRKLKSPRGVLEEVKDGMGNKVLRFKK